MSRDRRAFHVVDAFEHELCGYTGAAYAVATDSCTNALLLALAYERRTLGAVQLEVPRHTWIGVYHAARNAGFTVRLSDQDWQAERPHRYQLQPTRVVDSAREFNRNVYREVQHEFAPNGHLHLQPLLCLSFHPAKQLGVGRAGAVVTADGFAADWMRSAAADGRRWAGRWSHRDPAFHCYMPPPTAALALWALTTLPDQPRQLEREDNYPDIAALVELPAPAPAEDSHP